MAIVYCPLDGWHARYSGPEKCLADDPRVRLWGDACHESFFCDEADAPAFREMYGSEQVSQIANRQLGVSIRRGIPLD